jgi:hypothetical protein
MGAVARYSSWAVPVSLVLAAVVLAGVGSLPTSTPAPGPLTHLSPLGGGPAISVAPAQGPVGATYTVNGSGFSVNATANVTFASIGLTATGGTDCNSTATNITTDASGGFSCTFLVPSESAGAYPVTGNDLNTSTPSNTVSFTVTVPAITVTPGQGPQGAPVTVSGTGFSPLVPLTSLVFDSVTISACSSGSLTPNGTGVLSCSFAVPAGTSGTSVVATDATGATASATFTVTIPAITVVPSQGPTGSQVTVSGSGFTVSSTLASLVFDSVSVTSCSSGALTTDSSGAFACTFAVPSGTSGTTVVATDAFGAVADGTFTVTSVSITVDPGQGPVHSTVQVSGYGFSVSSTVTLNFDSVAVPSSDCTAGGLTTGSTGEFNCTLAVPAGTTGTTVQVTDSGGQSASGTFTVTTPAITVTPTQGPRGESVTVAGTGFSVSTALTSLVFDQVTITSCTSGSLVSNSTGGFNCRFPVPPGTSGSTVTATDASGQTATGTFTVTTPSLSVTPVQGPQGALVTVAGTGFSVSSTLASLDFDGVAVSSCTSGSLSTDSSGAFSCSFTVPSGTTTSTVTATDANGQDAYGSFTVTTPAIAVSPGHGPVGSPVDVRGTGFSVSTAITSLVFDGVTVTTCSSGTLSANATGVFTCTFPVPSGTSGTTVRATDVGGQSAVGSFQVTTESISLSPAVATGPVGAPFVITGTGFTASEGVRVTFGASILSPTTNPGCTDGAPSGSEVTTSAAGSFSCTFLVPSAAPGPYDVVATDLTTSTTSNSEPFEVTVPTIALSPGQGPIGGDFSVTGSGFTVSSTANFAFSSVVLTPDDCSVGSASGTSITTNGTGDFVCTFDVPTEGPSSYPVVATDLATSTASNSVTFTVTAVSLSASPNQGPVGTSVTISGMGFSVSTGIASFVFDGVTVSTCASGSLLTGATGAFACTITVPSGTSGSSVVATDAGGEVATTQFAVTVPSITVTPGQGTIGSTFDVSGSGFQGATSLTLTIGSVTLTPMSCTAGSFSGSTITTTSGGAFGCTFLLATQPGGSITLVATQGTNQASTNFVINPSFSISTSTGGVGTVISFSGSGFAALASYAVEWNASTPLCTGTTSASGSLSCSSTVPTAAAGPHTVSVVQGTTSAVSVFMVVPSISVSPASGAVGSTITVSGGGFDAGASYIVTWQSSATVCSGSTNSNGGFTCTFTVPSTTVGTATIMVSEGSYTPSYSFTVSAGPGNNSGPTSFPWWIVAVIALVAVALLILGLVYEHRRHHTPRAPPPRAHGYGSVGSPRPWDESSPTVGAVPVGAVAPVGVDAIDIVPAAGVGAAADASSGEANPEDIDALISRLERMSVQMFNKTPKQLSESSIAEAPAETDGK